MKKAINIVLIIFVLGLWGTIVYRYVNNLFLVESNILSENNKKYSLVKIKNRNTFNFSPLKRDPFLGNHISSNLTIPKPHFQKALKSKPPKIVVKNNPKSELLPTIQYYGIIKSSSKKDELVIIKINNTLQKLRPNSEYEGVKIKKVYKDSILISFNNKLMSIKRK